MDNDDPCELEIKKSGNQLTTPLFSKGEDPPNMATPAARPERVYHQDYIARIRYENALPPPPGPPKFLEIPMDGLNYYASAGFASRLARQQPLNIEADAELGMPIDLVGMPGIFDGDESSIQAPLIPPPVHPRDKNLLRPLSDLGKLKYQPGGISFLRRTEYISSEASRARSEAVAKNAAKSAAKVRKPVDSSKDEPINVLRAAVKGFDIANPDSAYMGPDSKENIRGADPSPAELEAWRNPKHPTQPELKLLDIYQMKPDLDAMTDSASYLVAKFTANPTQSIDKRDDRMDVGLLHPIEVKEAVIAEHSAKVEAHEANPSQNPHPGGLPYNYDLFLPTQENSAKRIKRKFDVNDAERDNLSLYTDRDKNDNGCFHYEHLRTYETARSTIDAQFPYKEVALALHDAEIEDMAADGDLAEGLNRLSKAAYYYPISQKVQLKPHRNKNLAHMGVATKIIDDDTDERIDAVDVTVRDLNDIEQERRAEHRMVLLDGGNGDRF